MKTPTITSEHERQEMLTKKATELVRRFGSHEWITAEQKYRRLLRVDEGWILIRSNAEVSGIRYAGQVTRAMPEASAVDGLVTIIGCGITVKSR